MKFALLLLSSPLLALAAPVVSATTGALVPPPPPPAPTLPAPALSAPAAGADSSGADSAGDLVPAPPAPAPALPAPALPAPALPAPALSAPAAGADSAGADSAGAYSAGADPAGTFEAAPAPVPVTTRPPLRVGELSALEQEEIERVARSLPVRGEEFVPEDFQTAGEPSLTPTLPALARGSTMRSGEDASDYVQIEREPRPTPSHTQRLGPAPRSNVNTLERAEAAGIKTRGLLARVKRRARFATPDPWRLPKVSAEISCRSHASSPPPSKPLSFFQAVGG